MHVSLGFMVSGAYETLCRRSVRLAYSSIWILTDVCKGMHAYLREEPKGKNYFYS